MPREFQNLPERPIDQLRRHETDIELLKEQLDDQMALNEQNRAWRERMDSEFRLLREAYSSDKRVVTFVWQAVRWGLKWSGYVIAAASGYVWTHRDQFGITFHNGNK